jgi:hypothetical protein
MNPSGPLIEVADLAHCHGRPVVFEAFPARVDVDAHLPALFPGCGDVEQAVTIDIGKTDSVRSQGRIVNRVTFPGGLGNLALEWQSDWDLACLDSAECGRPLPASAHCT